MVRTCILLSCVLVALLTMPSYAYPSPSNYFREEQYEPEQLMDMLGRLENLIQMEHKMENYRDDITRNEKSYQNEMLNDDMSSHEKRALDLGLSRGYSGALQAKHLMGIAAANFAGGPGRRRRNVAQ